MTASRCIMLAFLIDRHPLTFLRLQTDSIIQLTLNDFKQSK